MDLVGGGVDSRGSYVSKILYVKTKELGPLGGPRAGRPPRSANEHLGVFYFLFNAPSYGRIMPPKVINRSLFYLCLLCNKF